MSSLDYVNKVILLGRMTQDPILYSFTHGEMIRFSVATAVASKKNSYGEWEEVTEYTNCICTDKFIIPRIQNNTSKATRVYLEGQLKTNTWTDKTGIDRKTTSVVVKDFRIIEFSKNALFTSQSDDDIADDEIPF